MNEINKLVDLVTHGLKSNFDVIDLSGESISPGKEQQLYNGVLQEIYPTDEKAAHGMYKSDIYDQRFRMLKSRLRHKLYDLLYYYDFELPKYTYSLQVDLECKEYIHKAHILRGLDEFGMSDKQLNKAIVLAEENQLTSGLLEAYELKREILSYLCKPTDFELTIEKIGNLRQLQQTEAIANDLFLKIRMIVSKSIHSRNTSKDQLTDAVNDFKRLFEETKSYNIYQHYYQVNIWLLLVSEDFESLVQFTEQAISDVEKIEVNNLRFDLGSNSSVATRALLALGKFTEGYQEAENGLKIIDKSTALWFAHMENYFLLAMHNRDYAKAKEVLDMALKNPNYARSTESIVSRWKVFRIYLNFAMPSEEMLKRVRFNDIHKASDFYYKEAKGYFMTLPILEFIHKVNKEKLDEAEAKLDDVENYFFKFLNEPGKNPREKQFYKMIKILRSENYDAEAIRTKSAKYFNKLSEKANLAPFSDFEIIPYEHLWDVLLETVASIKVEAS